MLRQDDTGLGSQATVT